MQDCVSNQKSLQPGGEVAGKGLGNIQRRWRGYKIRKYCFNYYYLKNYLRAVSETNEAIREALDEFAEMKAREKKKADLEREEKERTDRARKMHYLLSTKQIPGIYNSPFRKEPDPWEMELRKVRLVREPRPQVKQTCSACPEDWLPCPRHHSLPQAEILPPINRKKCQGPFRQVEEVLAQRYKPMELTLRASEPFTDFKEEREELRRQECACNISDSMFLPFSNYHKNKKYLPLIHSSSKYGPASYGYQSFRDENPRKWICSKDFQSVLPSFELFSKFGKSYSKAGQII
ncbi:spermatogenesis-associated protein 17 [Erinaceus europaeus]|uniref:Spermatogenesis-associated protein 17 n=1 Tax=Erinaceus europaeus TaxID=9365 RepID=A0ABM3WF43_ERIEU|nr:spermatogenesis-associated protein 17 [Erinaceus europaeus]